MFFGETVVLLGKLMGSPLFVVGAVLAFLAGCLKVVWKMIVVLRKKNIRWMSGQLRILMPVGFLFMVIGFLSHRKDPVLGEALSQAVRMPVLPFLLVEILGFVLMGIFAAKIDSSKAKSNWIEQITNAVDQLSLLIAALLLTI